MIRKITAFTVGLLMLAACAAAPSPAGRYGDRAIDIIRLTNERYNSNCFWGGPRGAEYALLPADEIRAMQIPNLYPDVQATYFAARFKLPAGATLTLSGRYPHARYMSYALQTRVGDDYLAGDGLADIEIAPDAGAANPFIVGGARNSVMRDYSVTVAAGAPPSQRAANTIYTGTEDPGAEVTLVLRYYVPDQNRDGTGDAGLPRVTLNLADGARIEAAAACAALEADVTSPAPQGFPPELWARLVANSSDPDHAPAENPPRWERFWNVQYNTIGRFYAPEERARRFQPTDAGGFASNPHTRYLSNLVDLSFGPVFVIEGAMPRTPRTLHAPDTMPPHDLRYWSLCTGSAPSTGAGYDCIFDEQVAVREGRYMIVVSRPQDRPANAREACGVTWLDFGNGENIQGPHGPGRDYISVLYMRFMYPDRDWPYAPQRVTRPGDEVALMGAYFPQSAYSSVAEFEARGCSVDSF